MDQPEAVLLLHTQQVLGADDVGHPEAVVVVLTVPPPKLGCEMIHEIETLILEDS